MNGTGLLTPARRRGFEILDDPNIEPELVRRSLQDVARSNTLFGGVKAAMAELKHALPLAQADGEATLLDVGTGIGDIPAVAVKVAREAGIVLETFGLDNTEELAVTSSHRTTASVCGNALHLPFADNSFDFVMASQVLHHFTGSTALQVLREMHRVARLRVIISDIRRSWIAAGGLWIASFPLGFHPISRHDGVVSVMRGFTPYELGQLVKQAVGVTPVVHKRIGFRVTTSWSPNA